MENKCLFSLDIKSLYTNIPVNRCIERLDNQLRKTNTILLLWPWKGSQERTEHHGYGIRIYLQEQRMVTRT